MFYVISVIISLMYNISFICFYFDYIYLYIYPNIVTYLHIYTYTYIYIYTHTLIFINTHDVFTGIYNQKYSHYYLGAICNLTGQLRTRKKVFILLVLILSSVHVLSFCLNLAPRLSSILFPFPFPLIFYIVKIIK